ncbi:MAG TPA: hypothetical protein VK402_00820, partial [Blastococcus sp.]|nr:hypothetical protein [Blastococcus sp.]
TGLEHLNTARDLWRNLPMDKTLHLRWWFVPAIDVPHGETEQTEWLYQWWETIDDWIETIRRQDAADDGGARRASARADGRSLVLRRRGRPGRVSGS